MSKRREGQIVDKDLLEQLTLCMTLVKGRKVAGRKPKNKEYDKGFDIGFEAGLRQGVLVAFGTIQDMREKGLVRYVFEAELIER